MMKKRFMYVLILTVLISFNAIAQLKIVSGGAVGIGTATPTASYKLDVAGDVILSSYGRIKFNGTDKYIGPTSRSSDMGIISTSPGWIRVGSAGGLAFWGRAGAETNNTPDVFIGTSGGLGIGVTYPGYQLQLSTNSAAKPSSIVWTLASDKRLKTNITSYTKGLDVIRKLELVNYEYNGLAGTPKGEKAIGVIAQDFQKILPDAVKPFKYLNKETGATEEYLGVDFHELLMIYGNAMKELDKQVTEQAKQIEELTNKLGTGLSANNLFLSGLNSQLLQNIPNPFTENTTIGYTAPANAKNISISIFDMQGTLLKTYDQLAVADGKGSVVINGNELKAGMYMYSLIIDGKEIDTKRMILTK